jgi:hypothetical protein
MTEKTEEPTNDEPRPSNVIEAIAAVMRDLPAIGKDSEVTGDGPKYKFRGIEAITAAAQKLMGKYGVVFAPRIVGMERRDVSVGSKGAVWDEYAVTVEYDVYGPGGVEDCLPQPVRLIGLGRDNSDKGIAKSVTMTYKTALVQVFCIGDSKNDADNERHENADGERQRAERAPRDLVDRIKALPPALRDAFPLWLDSVGISRKPSEWSTTADGGDAVRIWKWVQASASPHTDDETPPPADAEHDEHDEHDDESHGTDGDKALGASTAEAPSEHRADGDGSPESSEGHESGDPGGTDEAAEPVAEASPEPPAEPEAPELPKDPEAIKAWVAGLRISQVRTELTGRNLAASGSPEKLRKDLTLALLRGLIGQDPDGTPASK